MKHRWLWTCILLRLPRIFIHINYSDIVYFFNFPYSTSWDASKRSIGGSLKRNDTWHLGKWDRKKTVNANLREALPFEVDGKPRISLSIFTATMGWRPLPVGNVSFVRSNPCSFFYHRPACSVYPEIGKWSSVQEENIENEKTIRKDTITCDKTTNRTNTCSDNDNNLHDENEITTDE